MKYAIVYSSQTGNTKFLAESIELLFEDKDYIKVETKEAYKVQADFFFIGFWTYRGECDNDTKVFLQSLKNKEVFIFGTAGFGRSNVYYARIMKKTLKYIDKSVSLYGTFMCQGRMSSKVRKKYEDKEESFFSKLYSRYMLKNYEAALDHPNGEDVKRLYLAIEDSFKFKNKL